MPLFEFSIQIIYWALSYGARGWEQLPQMEDAVPARPIRQCRRLCRRLFGRAGGDALSYSFDASILSLLRHGPTERDGLVVCCAL
jgi:hypothetical protein